MSLRRSVRSRRREIRKKGFILSFGDIILPFVGVVAIGLLVVAGKLFYINGLSPSVSVVPEADSESLTTQVPPVFVPTAEAKGEGTPPVLPSGQAEDVSVEKTHVMLPSQEEKTISLEITATPVVETPEGEKQNPASTPAEEAKPAVKAQGPAWRVQVGAYGSKSGANEIVSKLAKAGYKASVYSGTKYHKVWVQAGNTKQSAEAVASRLKKAGFPGSYVVPPPSR